MKILFRTTLILATIVALCACADKKDENLTEIEQRSFDAWMKKYKIDKGVNAERQDDNGMYIVWHIRDQNELTKMALGDWMELDYKGMTLDRTAFGAVFMLRDSITAKQEGTYSDYTRYKPQFMPYYSSLDVPEGLYYALKQMSKGDSATLYMPGRLAISFSSLTGSNGFGGHLNFSAGVPIMMDVKLTDIIIDPVERQEKMVREYAINKLGLTEKDTITKNLYIKIQYNTSGEERVKFKSDSTLQMEYTAMFLDHFLVDTNIGKLGKLHGRDTTAYTNPYSYRPASKSFVDAFAKVFESDTLAYDCSFQMVFTSDFGYGTSGNTGKAPFTIIEPHTPLFFDVKILPYKEKEKKD